MDERLTKRMNDISYSMCGNVILAKCENCNSRMPSCYEEDCGVNIETFNRLAAYEDSGLPPEQVQELAKAKAEGRLVELLPIDTEVFIVQDGEILGFRIYEYSLFSTNNLNIRYWSECITGDDEDDLDFWADDIGVAVFLSREAAEKAIAEVVGE